MNLTANRINTKSERNHFWKNDEHEVSPLIGGVDLIRIEIQIDRAREMCLLDSPIVQDSLVQIEFRCLLLWRSKHI
jgi:hypothetical protein